MQLSARSRRLLLAGSLGAMALLGAVRLAEHDTIPWGWLAAFAAGTALLAGPATWAIRDRLPAERRERLGYAGAVVALFFVPFVFGFGLPFGNLLLVLDAGGLGGVVGLAVALLAERTVVPDGSAAPRSSSCAPTALERRWPSTTAPISPSTRRPVPRTSATGSTLALLGLAAGTGVPGRRNGLCRRRNPAAFAGSSETQTIRFCT